MKIQQTTTDSKLHWKFIAETEEEKLILGALRNHYFLGLEDKGTFPQYDGMESEEIDASTYVKAIKFSCKTFK